MKRGTTEGGIVKTFRQGGCVVWCGVVWEDYYQWKENGRDAPYPVH